MTITSPSGTTFTFDKQASSSLGGLLSDLQGAGYKIGQAAAAAPVAAPAATTSAPSISSWITPEMQTRLDNLGKGSAQQAAQSTDQQALYKQLQQPQNQTTQQQQQKLATYQLPMLQTQILTAPTIDVMSNPIRSRNASA